MSGLIEVLCLLLPKSIKCTMKGWVFSPLACLRLSCFQFYLSLAFDYTIVVYVYASLNVLFVRSLVFYNYSNLGWIRPIVFQ